MKKLLLFIAVIVSATISKAQVVAEYNFNNTMNNVSGNTPFATNAGTSFTTDRFNNANGALNLGYVSTGGGKGGWGEPIAVAGNTTATIPNLPIGNSPRTISVWVQANLNGANNPIFSYGSSSANAAFGLGRYAITTSSGGPKPTISTATYLLLYGYANDLSWDSPTIPTTWTHFVATYDGTTATIYMNGVVKAIGAKAWNTANTVFRLGQDTSGGGFFFGAIDDLKIYGRAFTATEVSTLYNNTATVATPNITSISEFATSQTSTTIGYSLNGKDLATTSVINYGTSATALTSQVTGGSTSAGIDTAVSAVIPGLALGTTYYYQIIATNSVGPTSSAVRSFVQTNPSLAVAEYNFDGNLNNINGNTPFSGTGLSYDYDRNNNPSKALKIIGGPGATGASATIANLPLGNAARTVSIWVLQPSSVSDSHIFRYGTLSTNQCYGLSNQHSSLVNFGFANDLSVANQAASGPSWVHVVTTFDGTTAKIYRNGSLVASGNKAGWNTVSNIFLLGAATVLYIDDLKIYNRAITAAEVTNLYTSNSLLSTSSFQTNNLKASIYPNPAQNNFNIEMDNDLKSVEIYSLLGTKVLTAKNKNVNVSNLSKGIYMVRVEDTNNAVATKKLVIE